MASFLPDTDQIVADIDRAVATCCGYASRPDGLTSGEADDRARAIRNVVDHWTYLRYALEQEHAPLPAVWAEAARPDVVRLAAGAADVQLAELRRAAIGWGLWMETHPTAREHPGAAVSEAIAKADHLAACVAAVDAMCGTGNLPADWAAPYLQSLDFGGSPDPMVTARGGAAARAGWELPSLDLGPLPTCLHAWTVTAAQPAPPVNSAGMPRTAVLASCEACGQLVSWLLDGTWLRGENRLDLQAAPLPPQ